MEIDFEFRKERKLGEIVQDFINLLRIVLKHFFQTIFRLAIIPLCLMLVLIYYGTTRVNLKSTTNIEDSAELIVLLLVGFFILLVVSMVFFGLAIEYFLLLKQKRSTDFDSTDVWKSFKQHFGQYLKFLLVSIVAGLIIAVPLMIAMGIMVFIPFIGSFAAGILASFIGVWFFCAFLFYREGYLGATESMHKTLDILKGKFIDYSVSSYVVSFVFQVLLMMLTLMPTIVLGIIAYNTVGFENTFFDSFLGRMLTAIGGTLVVLLYLVYYMFSVLVYGIIYETAKEMQYGENVYEKIEHLGREEDAQ